MSSLPENLSNLRLSALNNSGFGLVTYKPGGQLGPRPQTRIQLVVIHRGELTCEIAERKLFVGEGEGILLPVGALIHFRFSPDRTTTHSWCEVPSFPAELLPPARAYFQPAQCSKRLLQWLLGGWKSDENPVNAWQLLTTAALMTIWEFIQNASLADSAAPKPPSLQRARQVIENRMHEPLTLTQIAREAGISPAYLSELATKHWHQPPMEFLWRRRVEEAARLLRDTGQSISEIAYQLGFANPFHFSRRFHHHFGIAPRTWRQRSWTPPPQPE